MTVTATTPTTTTPTDAPKLSLPDGKSPMSIHDVAARMRRDRETTAPADPPASVADEPLDAKSAEVETDELDVSDDGAPEPGAEAPTPQPALDAPSSYNPEERTAFAALPRPAQQAALRLEQSRRAAFSKDQQAAQTERASAEGLRQQVDAERRFLLTQVVPLLDGLQQATASEFADVRTPADVQRMAEVDPARFSRWQARQVAIHMAEQQAQVLQQREFQSLEEADRAEGLAELAKLPGMVKTWGTHDALVKGMQEVRDYVLQQPGLDQTDLKQFRKAAFVDMARKARLYDLAVAKRATASVDAGRAQPTPTTAAPNARRVASGSALAATNRSLAALQQSGSIDDALATLRARRGIRQ